MFAQTSSLKIAKGRRISNSLDLFFSKRYRSMTHARCGGDGRECGGGGCYYNLQQHFPNVLTLHTIFLLTN